MTLYMMENKLPNILITGTPGVGKSTLCDELSKRTSLEWVDVNKIAKENNFYESFDELYECPVLDEDKLLDELEGRIANGGKVVDYHSCDFFPERWFEIVFVLRTDNTVLYDRLKQRGYAEKKLRDNVECEIFGTILEEATESYKAEIVHELQSNNDDEMSANLERVAKWLDQWKKDNSGTSHSHAKNL